MKLIHSGDWHLGKIVNEFSMIEDQKFVLQQLLDILREEKPQALIIAGDLYDRSIPPVEAVELLDETFHAILMELKIPILVISGNHDSAKRLSFASSILNKNGLYIEGGAKKESRKVVLQDEYGPVNFYLVPYMEPREAKVVLEDDSLLTHDGVMGKVVEKIKKTMDVNQRNIMIAHGYVSFIKEEGEEKAEPHGIVGENRIRAGLELSDSERPLSIGGTDLIVASHFSDFNYTALGHLHSPQKVGSDKIRYAGSLLKYSVSETRNNKGVILIDLAEDGTVKVTPKPLIPKRNMRVIKGPLAELINPKVYGDSNVEDYVYALLTDEGELMDPISKLRAVYPNIMGLSRENTVQREISKTAASHGYKNKSKVDLFEEFYEALSGKNLTEEKRVVIKNVIEDVERECQ